MRQEGSPLTVMWPRRRVRREDGATSLANPFESNGAPKECRPPTPPRSNRRSTAVLADGEKLRPATWTPAMSRSNVALDYVHSSPVTMMAECPVAKRCFPGEAEKAPDPRGAKGRRPGPSRFVRPCRTARNAAIAPTQRRSWPHDDRPFRWREDVTASDARAARVRGEGKPMVVKEIHPIIGRTECQARQGSRSSRLSRPRSSYRYCSHDGGGVAARAKLRVTRPVSEHAGDNPEPVRSTNHYSPISGGEPLISS